MKDCNALRPIVLKGDKAIKAAQNAAERSRKDGRAWEVLQEVRSKPRDIVRRRTKA